MRSSRSMPLHISFAPLPILYHQLYHHAQYFPSRITKNDKNFKIHSCFPVLVKKNDHNFKTTLVLPVPAGMVPPAVVEKSSSTAGGSSSS